MFRIFSLQALVCFCFFVFPFTSCQQRNHERQLTSINPTLTSPNGNTPNETEPKYAFGLQLKTGDKYYYTINNTTNIHIEFGSKIIDNQSASTIGLLY